MTVASKLVVQGTGDGVFHGTRTVLQLVKQNRTIPGGTATDWPLYAERGLMLDVGRQYMSLEFLRARVRELSYLKLNQLHLHLSDRPGFRLESIKHPEITAPQHYTKQQMRELVAYAAKYHVQVVPEIDMPGHMDAILAMHPELKLVSKSGAVDHGAIDISKPAAYTLMQDLITEYLPIFPGKYWHIGADEYVTDYSQYPQLEAYAKAKYGPNATGKDAYYGYMNWANDLVRGKGKTARMWNDGYKPGGATLTVSPSIVVQHWSANGPGGVPWFGDAYTARQLAGRGHRVVNSAHRPLSYTVAGPGSFDNSHPLETYERWDPSIFVDGARLTDTGKNLGAVFQLWCDESTATEPELAGFLRERLRVLSQHSWRTPTPPFYAQFVPVMNAVGDAPG
jgi:hexosaminidase